MAKCVENQSDYVETEKMKPKQKVKLFLTAAGSRPNGETLCEANTGVHVTLRGVYTAPIPTENEFWRIYALT